MKQNVQAYFIGDKKVFFSFENKKNWDESLEVYLMEVKNSINGFREMGL